jgi:hypothetical protein
MTDSIFAVFLAERMMQKRNVSQRKMLGQA